MSPKPQKAAARVLVVSRKRGAAKGAMSEGRPSDGLARRSVGVPCDQRQRWVLSVGGTVPGCAGLCWTRVPIL